MAGEHNFVFQTEKILQYLLFNLTAFIIFSKLRKVITLDASSTDMIRIEKSLQAMVSCLCVIENHDNRLV